MTTEQPTIINAVRQYPRGGNGAFDFGSYEDGSRPRYGDCRLALKMSDGTTEFIEYYSDEITLNPAEMVGKTIEQAYQIKCAKDAAYLRGGI